MNEMYAHMQEFPLSCYPWIVKLARVSSISNPMYMYLRYVVLKWFVILNGF